MKIRSVACLGLLLVLGSMLSLRAQHFVEAALHRGRILEIDPDYPPNTQATHFVSASWSGRCSGRKAWHHRFGLPEWYVGASYFRFGNPQVLGQGLGLTPGLRFSLVRTPLLHLQLDAGIGLAWLNRPYDPISNPDNTAIGSHLNNLTFIQLRGVFFPEASWQPVVGLGYPHFSNANASVPNLGINIPSLSLGLRWRYRAPEAPAPDPLPQPRDPASRLQIRTGIRLGYGFNEHKVGGGPTYAVGVGSFFLHTVLAQKYRLLLGTEWFYSFRSYAFLQNQDVDVSNRTWASTGGVVFVGGELLLGHVSLAAYLGPYVKQAYQMPFFLYTKLGLLYHLTDQQKQPHGHPFLGVFVHAHSGEADFLELGLGWLF